MSWQDDMDQLRADFDASHPFSRGLVKFGNHQSDALVAVTLEQLTRGMTGKRFEGFDVMAFIFPTERVLRFQNGGVPLDLVVAFYDKKGEFVSEALMPADTATPVESELPAMYAIEMSAELYDSLDEVDLMSIEVPIAQFEKYPAESVNLRPAEPGAPERCSTCCFYQGNGVCEIVDAAGDDLVCDQYLPLNQNQYPEMDTQY